MASYDVWRAMSAEPSRHARHVIGKQFNPSFIESHGIL
jgi:hypothetical protein